MSRLGRGLPFALLLGLLLPVLLPTASAQPAHAASGGRSYAVEMTGYAFAPRSLTIHAGDTVTWTNQDPAPHDVTTTSAPASVHSPQFQKGQSWTYTFTTPGTYQYYCSVHPDMTAVLTVLAPATTAPAAPARVSARAAAPATHAGHPRAAGSSSAAAAAPAPAVSPTAAVAPAQAPAQEAAPTAATGTTGRLNPLLLLTGVVVAVAVLCLLLVASRSAAARE
ncbi:cupredoxin domain-containing protein [Phaeacidiphilus oryzae]|uniref:cupredoxin domain-containing protein n=1 Tax=Phaeacidiphilus oryzae TaxID=348818 RepID=UPI00055D49EE|nr:plastocyanin/azurin family copper-binding protein [Phaeacidiphilus oryzae]